MPQRPWYFETPGPSLVNEWTIVHFATGALWGAAKPDAILTGLVGHTAYEMIEGSLFPIEDRDVSMRNHVGDSLAFLAGMIVAKLVRR
jgi:hypothetical protein